MLVVDTLLHNIGQLVTIAQDSLPGVYGPLRVINNAALASSEGRITWIGTEEEARRIVLDTSVRMIDAAQQVITPGLVDSHTHLVFAGDRAEEFHLRRSGMSYGSLLAQGRGILSTMEATRAASSDSLLALAEERLRKVGEYGTTTVEIKTGYGLNLEAEERCLRIINSLNTPNQIRVIPTFLGAHSVPPEYRFRRKEYVDLVVEEMLPRFRRLADFCDVFCEDEAFTLEESFRILSRAKDLGYKLKIHAEQLNPSGGARLASELGAVSADHLDHATDADLRALHEAGVVATLLPGCSYTLRSPYPSARRFLDQGLRVALATDFNPGTCYCENLQMILGLGMSCMGMTLEEALSAITVNAAYALALQDEIGSIELGKRAELALWSIRDYHEIGYHFGTNLIQRTLVL